MSRLLLIGFMGAGKSSVGALVARDFAVPFIDLDAVIEEREGQSIPEIFAEGGEAAFRQAERAALLGLAEQPDAVVACGGGVITSEANRATLRELGTVVYLAVDADDVLVRVGETGDRPLLEGDPGEAVERLLRERQALYVSSADATVDTSGKDVRVVADEVVDAVRGV
jgi:shikimate kinase